jgi:Concanavalin A-like lectin/glucanases superfamily/FlgD Ig-like domain
MKRSPCLVLGSLLLALAAAPHPASAAAIAVWHFDEAPGATTAADAVGSVTGTLNGSAAFVPGGISGNAVSMTTAGGGFVDMGDTFPLTSGEFSIAAWIRTTDAAEDRFVVSRHYSGIVAGYILAINASGGGTYGEPGKAFFYHSHQFSGEEPVSQTTVNDDRWHLLVATFRPGAAVDIYVDGGPVEGSRPASSILAIASRFLVGGIVVSGTPQGYFNGMIDEVQLFDHALLGYEIQYLHDYPGDPLPELTEQVNLSTGWSDVAGALIPFPGTDDDWSITSAPPGTGTGPAWVTVPGASYFNPEPVAHWISDHADGSASSAEGLYTFERAIVLPDPGDGGYILSALYQSDNAVEEISLNGNVVSTGGGGNFSTGFEGPVTAWSPSHFLVGTNVLRFVVRNDPGEDPNPVGLVVTGSVLRGPALAPTAAGVLPAVEPAALASPNPFRNSTTIRLAGSANGGSVRVRVLDVQGRLVRTLRAAGPSSTAAVTWDGRDGNGTPLPAGVYFWMAEDRGAPQRGKVTKLR